MQVKKPIKPKPLNVERIINWILTGNPEPDRRLEDTYPYEDAMADEKFNKLKYN